MILLIHASLLDRVLDSSAGLTLEEVERVCARPACAGITRRGLTDYPTRLWDLVVGRAGQ